MMTKKSAPIFWFTGLSGAGKSTLAERLSAKLEEESISYEQLDGDKVRSIFPATGFTREDREEHLKRVGFLCSKLTAHGVVVVASFISPYESVRDFVRQICDQYHEIYVATPLDVCEERDIKGLYKKARAKEIKHFTGIDEPYEPPQNPNLVIHTETESVDESFDKIWAYVKKVLDQASSTNPYHDGVALWDEAKQLISGGAQLLSKRSEMFLPNQWPSYYQKAKGCKIWGLDGTEYLDYSHMSVGVSPLGYSDDEVNEAVIKAIQDGNISTLNSWEEVELAKKLIQLHPWSQSVRFSRSGGEACAIAVRLARAYTGQDKILFCGYHGWHDWYLSSNLQNADHLNHQLLPGLTPNGVPKGLKGTAIPFQYGDLGSFELGLKQVGIAGVVMEPVREGADIPFLKAVRARTAELGIPLIFDEITAGFRLGVGGAHLSYGIQPDAAILGKALGNGHPIAAVMGKRDLMEAEKSTFISSTYWTERVGFVAALATIKKMETLDVPAVIAKRGATLRERLIKTAQQHGFKLKITGLDALLHIQFEDRQANALQTLFTQEMLKKGYLASANLYPSYAHTKDLNAAYLQLADEVFHYLRQKQDEGTIEDALQGPEKQVGMKRLTESKVIS